MFSGTVPPFVGTTAYATANTGAIGLGRGDNPQDVRVECDEEFADGSHAVYILPRAQITSNFDRSFADAGEAPINLVAVGLAADSSVGSIGSAVWDNSNGMGIGRIGRLYMFAS